MRDINVTRGKTLPDLFMSSLLLSKTRVGLKHFFVNNLKYGNSVTLRIGDALSHSVLIFVLNASQLINLVIYTIIK